MLVDIKVSANSYPCIHDWNEDGNKDLIIGEIEHVLPDTGNIRIYLNTGTNAAPQFRSYQLMRAGNGHLEVVHAHPMIIDLDNDSLKDLVCGNLNGYIYFFKNRGTNQAPYFEIAYDTLMTIDSIFLDAYTNSRIHITDWTGDGDPDIIMGGQDGYVWVCENARITGAGENTADALPGHAFRLMGNPVTHCARFRCVTQAAAQARVMIYSVSGEFIAAIPLCRIDPETAAAEWRVPNTCASGVYCAVLKTVERTYSQKFVVLR